MICNQNDDNNIWWFELSRWSIFDHSIDISGKKYEDIWETLELSSQSIFDDYVDLEWRWRYLRFQDNQYLMTKYEDIWETSELSSQSIFDD